MRSYDPAGVFMEDRHFKPSEKEAEFKFYVVNMTVLNRQKFTEAVVNGDKPMANEPELMEPDDDMDSE